MDYQEKRILEHIRRWHNGIGRVATYKRIAADLGIEPREFRNVVAHLINEHGALIGSVSSGGYFWISNQEEFTHVDKELTKRFTSVVIRRSRLRENWLNQIRGKQQSLFEAEV